jgi:hypothetical protein
MPPTALIGTLESLRRRVRALTVLYGVGIVVAIAVGLLLGIILLDYLLNLLPIPRIIVMLLGVGCLIYYLSRWIIRPALAKLRLSDLAGKLEHAYPDFKDRLRSSVDFLTQGTPGSEAMKNRVVAEAAELAGRIDLAGAVQTRPVWESFAAGGGAILLLVVISLFAGREYLSPALSRLVSPFGNNPWPKRVQIEMVNDLPARVPVGKPVDVRMRLAKGDRASREARVYYQYGDGRIETEIMTRGADGVYSASLDARMDSSKPAGEMTVWIEAGDDVTQHKSIAIVRRLSVASAQLIVQPPSYVNEQPAPVPFDSTPATVTFGSSLTLKLTFNKDLNPTLPPLLSPGEQGGGPPQIAWDRAVGNAVTGHWLARESAAFQIHGFDLDGFASDDASDYQVIVRPDQMPSVQITKPARNEECTAQALVPLRAVAEDDFGIKSLKLVVNRVTDKPHPLWSGDLLVDGKPTSQSVIWQRLESTGDRRRWQLDFPWDIATMPANPPLKPGDVLEYHLEAIDNFAFEGKTHDPVASGKFRITIMSQEQFSSLMNDLVGQVREQLKDIRNAQQSLKGETEDLQHQTQSEPRLTRADMQQAQELSARQATAAAEAKQASGKLDDLVNRMKENRSTASDLIQNTSSVRDDLNQVAEHPMKDAAGEIDQARDARQNADDRNKNLAAAQANQADAAQRLDQMISRMGESGGLTEAIETLKNILNQQRQISQTSNDVGLKNLGKRPDQMSPSDQKSQQANADAQQALSDRASKALDQMQQSSQQMQKSDPAAAQAMKQAAQTGQEQSVSAQMKASADAQRQNQQSNAQSAQAQVEVGLQMMIHQLEEAQRQKLEALARQLADLQAQMKNLLRQQSGLNCDNLALQGGDAIKKIDPKTITHLLELSERVKDHLPPTPDLDTQTRLQQQTERNTRGVSKSAQSLPDGASIVADLNRAADRMGRAISALRDGDGPDQQHLAAAYDSPQVEALAALEQASDLIDKQANKANHDLNQQKRDAIRTAYQKILESQKKIDADTLAIDKAPRNDDGQLNHRDNVLLGQLVPRQGVLADTTAKLDNDLQTLNSIVYVWANKDIVDSMNGVKQDLAKPQTDVVTQAQQTRIEEQLQAMIDALSVKPKEIPFANKSNGGGKGSGQGSGGQTLPTEAELRLEKSLQQAVNKATITISQKAGDSNPELTSLGNRQSELRNLLDKLLQASSHGQMKLGPEPDMKDKVPEEATSEDIDEQELTQALLKGDANVNPDQIKNDVNLIGQRMGRSHQRLALDHDPGKVTQEIQDRILKNMDALIDMARQQEAETKSQSQQQSSGDQQAQQNGQAQAQAHNNNQNGQQQRNQGTTPAAQSVPGHDVDTSNTPTADITQGLKEWGNLSPRQRAAVIEADSEKPIQKFKDFVEQYYRALGDRQAQ